MTDKAVYPLVFVVIYTYSVIRCSSPSAAVSWTVSYFLTYRSGALYTLQISMMI